MESLLFSWIATLVTIATVALAIYVGEYGSLIRFSRQSILKLDSSDSISIDEDGRETHPKLAATINKEEEEINTEDLAVLKRLYYQLHSLEMFPGVVPQARRLLLFLLKETSVAAQALPDDENILSVQPYSRPELERFQRRRDHTIGKEWEKYNLRRERGEPRELFNDRHEAIWWLKQIAPVKYVDGAWLGYIGKVTTPFGLWKTMKGAWQILSEELGDGDFEKNHVYLYHKLLDGLESGLPTPETLDFGHPRHQLDQLSVWKSAIAQLLISLFPHEFLPEILGFNLHFEAISMDTLKAGMELKEVGIDPYYFILHISIDNTHSGHSAIAIEVVCEYMDYIDRTEGPEAAQRAWKKIQAGYSLSLCLPGTVVSPSRKRAKDCSNIHLNPIEAKVVDIFKAKSQVVHGIHCSSRVRIGSRRVTDWLDPIALESKEWQVELLNALSSSKYWICRGDSGKSRFIQELQWNGRMFGSFSQEEYDILRAWIDHLPNLFLALEGDERTGEGGNDDRDILLGHPVFSASCGAKISNALDSFHTAATTFTFDNLPFPNIGGHPITERILPLWFSHPCLLQTLVSVPFRTKSKFASTMLKILRAQGGFDIERECPAGMDEVRRPNSFGLAGIGMNIMLQHGLSLDDLSSLKDVLQAWPSEFAVLMLHISMRPMKYKGLLIGMTTAFAKLHSVLAIPHYGLLPPQDQDILMEISQRELEGLKYCWEELRTDKIMIADCCRGFLIAMQEIEKCFSCSRAS